MFLKSFCWSYLILISSLLAKKHSHHHSAYRWTEDGLLQLSRGVLGKAKQEFPTLILYVYGDWCLSAQSSIGKFTDLAHQHQIIDTKLVFGILEVKHQKELEKLSLKEVPAIIAFKRGAATLITWQDNPDFDAIAHNLEQIFEDEFIRPFHSWKEFANFRKNSSVVLYHGVSEDPNSKSVFWDFYKTSENHFNHFVAFGKLAPNEDSAKEGLKMNSVYFCRKEPGKCLQYQRSELNIFELYEWVNSLTDDPLTDIDGEGLDKVLQQRMTSLVAVF